jgi:hypothetical protein
MIEETAIFCSFKCSRVKSTGCSNDKEMRSEDTRSSISLQESTLCPQTITSEVSAPQCPQDEESLELDSQCDSELLSDYDEDKGEDNCEYMEDDTESSDSDIEDEIVEFVDDILVSQAPMHIQQLVTPKYLKNLQL